MATEPIIAEQTIEWAAPPIRNTYRPSRWVDIAAALRGNPGQWALVDRNVTAATATNIKTGRYKGFAPAGAFEAVSRSNGYTGRRVDVYARYVGETEATP